MEGEGDVTEGFAPPVWPLQKEEGGGMPSNAIQGTQQFPEDGSSLMGRIEVGPRFSRQGNGFSPHSFWQGCRLPTP